MTTQLEPAMPVPTRKAIALACLLLAACNDDIAPDAKADAAATSDASQAETAGATAADAAPADAVALGAGCVFEKCPDDGNPCTTPVCNAAGQCDQAPNGKACDDGLPCTVDDNCKGKACAGGKAKSCDDGKACTLDGCDALKGDCTTTPITGDCDDGSKCTTGDKCVQAACVPGTSKSCEDGVSCTLDSCEPATAECKHAAATGGCNDDNPCTIGDTCKDSKCVAGAKVLDCNDKNECTSDVCEGNEETSGCKNPPLPDGTSCGPDNVCVAGACK